MEDPMQLATTSIDTPLGRYALAASELGLVRAKPADGDPLPPRRPPRSAAERQLDRACSAFESYFAGDPAALAALPLDPRGTEFQRAVWRALREIPLGATATYGEIARAVGRPGAARAVGDANRRNPIAIAVPCHRVIGGDGRLVGYAGGLARKRWLLAHEAAIRDQAASSKSNGPESARLTCAPARSRASAAASI
jgi:methylated-DNA-[protein]-cysteine S-methyltransferase